VDRVHDDRRADEAVVERFSQRDVAGIEGGA
jgi:hypothetical protein